MCRLGVNLDDGNLRVGHPLDKFIVTLVVEFRSRRHILDGLAGARIQVVQRRLRFVQLLREVIPALPATTHVGGFLRRSDVLLQLLPLLVVLPRILDYLPVFVVALYEVVNLFIVQVRLVAELLPHIIRFLLVDILLELAQILLQLDDFFRRVLPLFVALGRVVHYELPVRNLLFRLRLLVTVAHPAL